MTEKHVNLTGN